MAICYSIYLFFISTYIVFIKTLIDVYLLVIFLTIGYLLSIYYVLFVPKLGNFLVYIKINWGF